MKPWMRRSLIGLAATATLLGGLAACSHGGHAGHAGHGRWSVSDTTEMRGRFIERAAGKLDLDAAQKARLATLAGALQAQRAALWPAGQSPRVELQALIAGSSFDRSRAQALVDAKTAAVRDKAPAVVTAMADFYDSLKPEQQQTLRDMLARGGRGGWGWRG